MLYPTRIMYGTDPEGFFKRHGAIIGAERIIPAEGLGPRNSPTVVIDGIQFELNPWPQQTIVELAYGIASAMRVLRNQMMTQPEVQVFWDGLVEVSEAEINNLSPKARVLGCMPSRNVYGVKPITVNPLTYRKRSAGGHLHLGLGETNIFRNGDDERARLVFLLDIFVGSPCVLLDRDPGAKERRENYGRAGEYRLPKHGLEYRTLSNFWLKNFSLMTFVFGMANLATSILNTTMLGTDLEQEVVDLVNIDRVQEAINENDFGKALQNFNDILPFIVKHVPESGFPLGPSTLEPFINLVETVERDGWGTLTPDSPMEHWCRASYVDFRSFIRSV